VIVGVAGGLLLTVACGHSLPLASDQQQIRDDFKAFVEATVNGDGNTACDLLTNQARRAVESNAKGLPCPQVVASAQSQRSNQRKAQLLNSGLRDIQVRGDDATATFLLSSGSSTSATPAKFRRERGTWKLAAVDSPSAGDGF